MTDVNSIPTGWGFAPHACLRALAAPPLDRPSRERAVSRTSRMRAADIAESVNRTPGLAAGIQISDIVATYRVSRSTAYSVVAYLRNAT